MPDKKSTWGSILTSGLSAASSLMSPLPSAFGKETDTSYNIEQGVGDALMAVPTPYTMAAGAAVKGFSALSRLTDSNTSTMSDKEARALGLNGWQKLGNNFGSFWQNIGGFLPGMGAAFKKTGSFALTDEAQSVGGGYGQTMDYLKTMQGMSGKRYLFNDEAQNGMVNARNLAETLTQTGLENKSVIQSAAINSELLNRRNMQQFNDQGVVSFGKTGLRLLSKSELQKIYAARKDKPTVDKFQNGGSILIPDGALHATKNHIEDSNPELGNELTKKGIPVVITDDNAKLEQVAEIERDEMILEKELTQKIEELWKDGSEEAMIEAGKIITNTLFHNCDDNTNLVKSIN